jgi:hypothetical protein
MGCGGSRRRVSSWRPIAQIGGSGMRHYSLEKWVDFARNVIREDEKAEMQGHLETGCAECSRELSIWQRLQQLARRESAYEPVEGAVRTVNAIFANQRSHRTREAKSGVAALLFDSFRSPLPAGVRSTAGSTSRQLLYGADGYRIDIRIEPQMDKEKAVLIGQVLNSADPDERLSEVPVTLLKGRKILTECVTSKFGEFQMECDLEGGFRLMLILPGQREVSLPLIEPRFGQDESMSHPGGANRLRRKVRMKKKGTRTKD